MEWRRKPAEEVKIIWPINDDNDGEVVVWQIMLQLPAHASSGWWFGTFFIFPFSCE
jgi:hypothetical protein